MSKCPCGFCHLHVHSEYSLLDGGNRVKDIAKRAAEMDMPAVALTDHGVMYGAIDHYAACQAQGVKGIIGVEAYVAPRKHTDKDSQLDSQKLTNHLTLWAKNLTGYKNLVKMTTKANLHGFYYKPRVDHELLAEHSEGLAVGSACLGGEIPQLIIGQKFNDAVARAEKYREIFGKENFFLELMDHDLHGQDEVNQKIIDIHHKTGIPLVATNDAHYNKPGDDQMHKILVCIGTNTTLEKPAFDYGPNFYMKTADEMWSKFKHVPEAIENTMRIAEMCNLELDLKTTHFPHFDVPHGHTLESYFRHLCEIRFSARYPKGHAREAEARQRMAYEQEIIVSKGYPGYFLVVQDFINWSKERGILVGCRGSAAGCLVSYVLGITNLDPLPFGLLFERFLNPDRVSTPDIDVDFPDKRRDEVMRYVQNKYGKEKVAHIITFGTLAARAAVKDTGRVKGLDPKLVDTIAKLIPAIPSHPITIKKALDEVKELRDQYETNSQVRDLLDSARGIEGLTRHASRHACGVVIGKDALDELVPLEEKDGVVMTQYHSKAVEKVGLVKMDFLGLQNNTVINDTLELIEERRGEKIDLETIELEDKSVYDSLGRGDGIAVFQMEGVGMRKLLREMKPENLEHIIAQISLYRPGPMDEIPRYIKGRFGGAVTYPHAKLEPVLKDTYGMLLYQEQVMQAAQVLAGFTGGQAETLMKAMSKKKADDMAKMKPLFLEGCKNNRIGKADAEDIFDKMEAFARYAFNKCISGLSTIKLPNGQRMTLAQAYREKPEEILAMWPDGEIRSHRVQRIVQTGRKPLFKIRTRANRVVMATAEHRFLSTEGYKPVEELRVGMELMAMPRPISDNMRRARSGNMRRVNARPERKKWAAQASERMVAYQAARPMEEKAAHMKRMHELHPDLTRAGTAAMHERVRWLMANDPEWRAKQINRSIGSLQAVPEEHRGYGHASIASNGMWCASRPEREMCEWLITQDVEFEMHKQLANGRYCDFYFAGVYWEMDGMDRVAEYFEAKYGELPFIVVTPEDFKFKVEHHLQLAHAQNGDPIVSIEPCGEGMTYDIEMAPDGPLNFIANGLVSHNSHAAYYGLVSYWTAWLKTNYAPEFLACKMTSLLEKKDKLLVVIDDCRRRGLQVLAPDINESNHEFTVVGARENENIRFGLKAIKGIGDGPVNAICEARKEGGKFVSLFDFCERVSARAVNKSALEVLVKCGAFDSVHVNRQALLDSVPAAMDAGARAQANALSGQSALFAIDGASIGKPKTQGQVAESTDASREQRLMWEKELLGLYISDHPLLPLRNFLDLRCTGLDKLGEEGARNDAKVTVGGMVTALTERFDKNSRKWAIVTLEDLTGTTEVLVFAKSYEKCGSKLAEDAKILVHGRVSADQRRGGFGGGGGDDEGGDSDTVYKIMADDIELIPVDQVSEDVPASEVQEPVGEPVAAPAPTPVANSSYSNGSANGNGHANGNGAPRGSGISITRSSADAPGAPPPMPAASVSNGAGGGGGYGGEFDDEIAQIGRFFEPPEWAAQCVHLHIDEGCATATTIGRLWNICKKHHGDTEVWLHIDNGAEMMQLRVAPDYWVELTPEFEDELRTVLADGCYHLPF